jgi:hypothetical protein
MLNPITCNRPRATIAFLLVCLFAAALALSFSSCGVTPARFDDYQRAVERKDKAIANSTVAFVEERIDEKQHLDNVDKAQKEPEAIVTAAKNDLGALTEWGDFALAIGKTLGVPGIVTGAGMLALDRIRNNRRRKRGEPVDTDGDGIPDAQDDQPLVPNAPAPAPTT